MRVYYVTGKMERKGFGKYVTGKMKRFTRQKEAFPLHKVNIFLMIMLTLNESIWPCPPFQLSVLRLSGRSFTKSLISFLSEPAGSDKYIS